MAIRMHQLFLLLMLGSLVVAPAAAEVRHAAAPATVPFVLEGHSVVVEAQIGGQRLPFAFDSGLSGGAIVTPDTVSRLGLKSDSKLDIHDAGGDQQSAASARIAELSLGSIRLTDVIAAVIAVPDPVIQRADKTRLAGYLGAPLLKDSVLCLDYHAKTLTRWPREGFDGKRAGLIPVPLRLNHGVPTIAAIIDGRPATLIVDTGNAGGVVLYEAFAQRNEFPRRYRNFRPGTASGGSGQALMMMAGTADELALGPGASFENAPMQVIPQGMDPQWAIDGMLGRQLLEQIDPCVDRDGGRFWFKAG